MDSSKKILLTTIGIAVLIVFLSGVTFAFFNYTRTGSTNVIKVGRIYFNTSQDGNINLTNVFPISSEDLSTDENNHDSVTITITGDTTYDEGVEYLVTLDEVNNTINNKKIPVTFNIEATDIGTSDNDYYTNRGGNTSIYRLYSEGEVKQGNNLLVGYISKGSTGINGNIKITAYVDKEKIAISDTYDVIESDENGTTRDWVAGRETFTTEEWNSFQGNNAISFKVRVEANEGTWFNDLRVYNLMKKSADLDTQINFNMQSSDTNGKGLYRLKGTENDTFPIYYYRGDINNNNVIFGGFCWQIIRTTDTGGIKMIYNGNAKKDIVLTTEEVLDSEITYTNDTMYPYSYDSNTNKWTSTNHTDDATGTFIFSVNTAGEYIINYSVSSERNWDKAKFYKNDTLLIEDSGTKNNEIKISNLSTSDIVKVEYVKDSNSSSGNDNVVFNIIRVTAHHETENYRCTNTLASDRKIGNSQFNVSDSSLSDVGYMSNARYTTSSSGWTKNALFASSATWVNDHYELTDASVTTPDSTHHYSCNSVSANATCTNLRYVYDVSGTTKYYITLTGGELIEDALYKMTGNGTDVVKEHNSDYILNQNDSVAKTTVEDWFKTNLTNEVDSTKRNYQEYLEDTVYCNDRSYKVGDGDTIPSYQQSGWNPNGGEYRFLNFGTRSRYRNNWYSEINVPSMTCPNETDSFRVSNPKARLKYPVGLLTADEAILAGPGGNSYSANNYLANDDVWTMSPDLYNNICAEIFTAQAGIGEDSSTSSKSIRPVISLKHTIEFEIGGDGTPTNPYVVKYN